MPRGRGVDDYRLLRRGEMSCQLLHRQLKASLSSWKRARQRVRPQRATSTTRIIRVRVVASPFAFLSFRGFRQQRWEEKILLRLAVHCRHLRLHFPLPLLQCRLRSRAVGRSLLWRHGLPPLIRPYYWLYHPDSPTTEGNQETNAAIGAMRTYGTFPLHLPRTTTLQLLPRHIAV